MPDNDGVLLRTQRSSTSEHMTGSARNRNLDQSRRRRLNERARRAGEIPKKAPKLIIGDANSSDQGQFVREQTIKLSPRD